MLVMQGMGEAIEAAAAKGVPPASELSQEGGHVRQSRQEHRSGRPRPCSPRS